MVRRRSGIALRDTSRVYFTLHETELLELVFVGRISELAIENASGAPTRICGRTLLLDCEGMTTFDPEAQTPAIRLFKAVRELGVRRLSCVAPFASQRVTVAALAFLAELDLELFRNRADALSSCTRRTEPPSLVPTSDDRRS
jgi:hypothetical protein